MCLCSWSSSLLACVLFFGDIRATSNRFTSLKENCKLAKFLGRILLAPSKKKKKFLLKNEMGFQFSASWPTHMLFKAVHISEMGISLLAGLGKEMSKEMPRVQSTKKRRKKKKLNMKFLSSGKLGSHSWRREGRGKRVNGKKHFSLTEKRSVEPH